MRYRILIKIINEHIKDQERIRGAEIGVWHAPLSMKLLKHERIELLMVDAYAQWSAQRSLVRRLNAVRRSLKITDFAADRRRMMIMSSKQAAELVPDAFLDFVFIDADHKYESVLEDIHLWTPKVRKDGIVSGHDYDHPKHPGVKQAVYESFPDHKVSGEIWYTIKKM
jgi:hypothetical protein